MLLVQPNAFANPLPQATVERGGKRLIGFHGSGVGAQLLVTYPTRTTTTIPQPLSAILEADTTEPARATIEDT